MRPAVAAAAQVAPVGDRDRRHRADQQVARQATCDGGSPGNHQHAEQVEPVANALCGAADGETKVAPRSMASNSMAHFIPVDAKSRGGRVSIEEGLCRFSTRTRVGRILFARRRLLASIAAGLSCSFAVLPHSHLRLATRIAAGMGPDGSDLCRLRVGDDLAIDRRDLPSSRQKLYGESDWVIVATGIGEAPRLTFVAIFAELAVVKVASPRPSSTCRDRPDGRAVWSHAPDLHPALRQPLLPAARMSRFPAASDSPATVPPTIGISFITRS